MQSDLRLYDNTRLSDYRRCPRYYFYRHVMHWKPVGRPSAALVFGSSWHAAMDVVWQMCAEGHATPDVLDAAYEAFCKTWTAEGYPPISEMSLEDAQDLGARTPGTAHEMLMAYFEKREKMMRSSKILAVERSFAVPLSSVDPKLFYIGRIDKILEVDSRRVRAIEHKTTTATKKQGQRTKIRPLYMEGYSPNSQVDGYLFAMQLLYPHCKSDVWVDAVMVHKLDDDCQFIPIDRQIEHLDSWLFDTHSWIKQLETDMELLSSCGPEDRYMAAFPKNTGSCFDFNAACPFLKLCKSRPNPKGFEGVPTGYEVSVWDPLDHSGRPDELK